MLPTRQTPDLLLGMWSLIEGFGRVPRRLIWDNEAGIGRRGRLAAGVAEFCGTLATRVHQLKPHDPESKGVVERRNGFFETSFMPGRSFDSPADFNAQFSRLARAGEPACGAHAQGPPDRSGRRRPGSDAGVAADPTAGRLVEPDPARPRLLRARRLQRLLRRPDRDRPPGHRHRRPGTGPGASRRPARRRPRPGVGPPHDRHRPRPRRHRPAAARAVRPSTDASTTTRWRAISPTTTAPSGSSTGRSRDGRQAASRRPTRSSRSTSSPPR